MQLSVFVPIFSFSIRLRFVVSSIRRTRRAVQDIFIREILICRQVHDFEGSRDSRIAVGPPYICRPFEPPAHALLERLNSYWQACLKQLGLGGAGHLNTMDA